MKRILVLMLAISMVFCNMVIAASAEEELITFDAVAADGKVDKAHLSDFTVSVDESVTVSGVELLEDGVSLGEDTEAPYSFALNTGKLGARKVEAIVRDSSGEYIFAEKEITVVEYATGTVCSADFNSYTGGAGDVGTQHWINSQGAPDVFDRGDDNGTCLKLSYDNEDQWPQFRHYGNSSDKLASTNVHFETDFYVDQSVKGNGRGWSTYSWNAFGPTANGNQSNRIISISVSPNGTNINFNGQSFPINQQQWYRIVFEYDWVSGNTSLWVDGEPLVKNVIIEKPYNLASLTWIQGDGNLYGGSVCFDNWDMWMILASPFGTGLAEGEKHPYTEDSVTLGFTQGIVTVDTSTLKLKNEIGDVKIESAQISTDNKTITVTPTGGFLPSNTYELTVPAKTIFTGGTLAEPLKIRFKTSPEATDVISGKIQKGAAVSFSAELINTSGNSKTFTAYLCSYRNGVFYKLEKKVSDPISGGSPVTITTPSIEKASDITYKAFVVDENGTPVTDKFYALEIN